jgi:RNA polymerase sigma-70 factor (family 1)
VHPIIYIAYSLSFLTNHTDQELLEAIKHSDDKAFSELFKRHWRKVHAMAYSRVRSRQVTEEIVQDLFMSLWNKRATLSIKNLPAYLFQAVKFKVLNYIDAKLVHEKYWNYYKNYVPREEEATQFIVEYDDLVEAIQVGMKELPEKSKKVFQLHKLEGWSVPEIASLLNLSEKAIQYHLTQSVKKLRVHLKNYIISLTVFLNIFY